MKTSKDRILTTHTGSLPRPKALTEFILTRETGGAVDAASFEAEAAMAVDDVVGKQVAVGIGRRGDPRARPQDGLHPLGADVRPDWGPKRHV